MQLSPYQLRIIEAVQERITSPTKKGLVIEALAGAGKSTMIWLICQELRILNFSPQEVAAVVFGRKNKEDLQKKIEQKVGSDWGVVIRTLHSLCYGIYRDALNVSHQRVKNESSKYTKIAQEFGLFPLRDDRRGIDTPGELLEGRNPAVYSEKDFTDLLDRLRLYCLEATQENVRFLIDLYKLGINDIGLVASAAEQCLGEGLKVATNQRFWIDMTDMVWVPWAMRSDSRFSAAITGRREQFRFLLLDEAQDTDLLQIEMLSLLVDPARSFLTAVGDRFQCVVQGTQISLPNGSTKSCEAIEVGDVIATGWGANQVSATQVEEVFVRAVEQQPVIRIKTKGGYEVTTTPEHIHFAGYKLGSQDNCYFTYLMEKEGVGFRVGTTQRYRKFTSTNQLGFKSRTHQERADKLWILEVSQTEVEARYWEAHYSAAFGLPTVTFLEVNRYGRKKRSDEDSAPLGMAQEYIDRLFNSLPTIENAHRLLESKHMLKSQPHHTPKCMTTKRRRNFVVTMCADSRSPNCCLHRADLGGSNMADTKLLESIGVKVTANGKGKGGWRVRYESRDLKNIYNLLYKVESVMDVNVIEKACLTKNGALPFCPAAHVRQGMLMAVQVGNLIELDTVETVEQTAYTGDVYDFKVARTHNFIANGIVTHNSVYFFRGALNDGMDRITTAFQGENLPLPVCYRCGTKHLELVREVFPSISIQPRPGAPSGEIRVVLSKDFHKIFDDEHLSYIGVCRKNAPLVKAAIQLLAAGKPAKIKDRNIGGRLVARVKDIYQKQRVKYNPETFIRVSVEYEQAQRKRLQDFPNSENQILDLTDMLEAIRALFQAYEPDTFKAWERIVEKIFDESGYSPISLYTIHSGKGGEGQVSFILYPEDLPLIHPRQVNEEREQEDHLLYVSLTRTLADGQKGSGILYLVCREAGEDEDDDDDETKHNRSQVKWPEWLPKKYRKLWKWDESHSPKPEIESNWSEAVPLVEPNEAAVSPRIELESSWSQHTSSEETLVGNGLLEEVESQADVDNEEINRFEIPQPEPTDDETNWSESLDDLERQELTALEEKIKQAIATHSRWYEGGKALAHIRDKRLYRETHSDFHLYCKQRFGKTRRHIDRWIAAAAALDNLTKSGCEILPSTESVLRPIASLSEEKQIEVWNRAVSEVGRCPTATKVEEVRNEVLGIPHHTELTTATDASVELTETIELDDTESLESQARRYIRTLPLEKMKALHSWLGDIILSLEQEDF